ncbi:MAG: translation initiation factor IF-5A [Promethearchaeota archaeon]
MSMKIMDAGSLKIGRYILIDEEPCRIVSIEKSKSGKHGHAKVRIVAIGLFDGVKRSIVLPSDAKVQSPIIDKRVAQINYITDATPPILGLMDMESFENFEMPAPDEESFEGSIEQGAQVEYWIVMERRKLIRSR